MNQRTFLGLTHNPFTPPRDGFFAGADRKTHLDHLRHLSQWSRRILVVTGPFGIGKSSLFRELSGSLEPNTRAARLSGTVVTTERETLTGLLQGFGIAADLEAHPDHLADLIARHADEQESLGRVCIVMADDAHLLEVQAVQRLVSLVAKSSLRMLLFAEASFISSLNRATRKHELEWFEIRLTGFPKADVREYLEWRFTQAHYRGLLPFTDEQLEKIVARSGGNPSVVDSMANRLLSDMESGEIRNQSGGFPVMHASLAVLLVVFIGLVYLFVQEDPLVDLGFEDQAMRAAIEQGDEVPEPSSLQPGDDEPGDTVSDSEGAIAETAIGPEQSIEASVADDSDAASDELVADELAAAAAATEVSVERPNESPGADPTAGSTRVDTDTSTAGAADDSPPLLDAAPDVLAADEAAEPPPTSVAGAGEEVAETVEDVVALPAAADTSSADVGFKSAQWLLDQQSERFTMQLLSLSSRERAVAFIERQANVSEFALYRMQRDGRTLYVITYGVFSTRGAAQSAADGFTGELADLKPWIRPLSLVQDTVRGNVQE